MANNLLSWGVHGCFGALAPLHHYGCSNRALGSVNWESFTPVLATRFRTLPRPRAGLGSRTAAVPLFSCSLMRTLLCVALVNDAGWRRRRRDNAAVNERSHGPRLVDLAEWNTNWPVYGAFGQGGSPPSLAHFIAPFGMGPRKFCGPHCVQTNVGLYRKSCKIAFDNEEAPVIGQKASIMHWDMYPKCTFDTKDRCQPTLSGGLAERVSTRCRLSDPLGCTKALPVTTHSATKDGPPGSFPTPIDVDRSKSAVRPRTCPLIGVFTMADRGTCHLGAPGWVAVVPGLLQPPPHCQLFGLAVGCCRPCVGLGETMHLVRILARMDTMWNCGPKEAPVTFQNG